MISLQQVTRRFGNVLAVDNLSFDLDDGCICVLIGPSGCGKTTTLRMINRLVEPTSGRILVGGKDTRLVKPEVLRRSIGYAIQGVGLFPHLTVADNIATVPGLLRWDKSRVASRVEEMLELVALDPNRYSAKFPHELSGGEAQRVGVARALAADPPVLLMDEPFGAVDPLNRQKLQTQFLRIQQKLKKTILFVTHDLDEAIRLADRIAIMDAGHVVQFGTPEEILARPANRFVHDFVGADRALKRLARIGLGSLMRSTTSIPLSTDSREAAETLRGRGWSWVVDDVGVLAGWVDRDLLLDGTRISEALVKESMEEIALPSGSTLRDALSRMLGQGVHSLPVVDDSGKLLGEVTLQDIEAATREGQEDRGGDAHPG